jgi:hypothetical protein
MKGGLDSDAEHSPTLQPPSLLLILICFLQALPSEFSHFPRISIQSDFQIGNSVIPIS